MKTLHKSHQLKIRYAMPFYGMECLLQDLEEFGLEIVSVRVMYIRSSSYSVDRYRVTICDFGQVVLRIEENKKGLQLNVGLSVDSGLFYWPADMICEDMSIGLNSMGVRIGLNSMGVRGDECDYRLNMEHWPSLLKALRRMLN